MSAALSGMLSCLSDMVMIIFINFYSAEGVQIMSKQVSFLYPCRPEGTPVEDGVLYLLL